MSTKWRRFEVMLPRQFNDGRNVPPEWLSLAALEIGDQFGSVSYETQIIEGRWQHAHYAAPELGPSANRKHRYNRSNP